MTMIGADTIGSGIANAANGIIESTTATTSIVGGSALKTKTEMCTAHIAKGTATGGKVKAIRFGHGLRNALAAKLPAVMMIGATPA
jgi:hypothetical protein